MFDGALTFIYGYRPTRLALPPTLRPDKGSYVELEGIRLTQITWLRVSIDSPAPVHADGEIFAPAARELEYRVWPGRLSVLI